MDTNGIATLLSLTIIFSIVSIGRILLTTKDCIAFISAVVLAAAAAAAAAAAVLKCSNCFM